MNNQISPSKELLLKSWEIYKSNIVLMIAAFLCYMVAVYFLGFITTKITAFTPSAFTVILMNIAVLFFNSLLMLGIYKIAFEISLHRRAQILDIFKNGNLLLQFVAANLLYGFIVAIGIILLFVPGIIWAVQFCFYPLFIIDKNLGPIEALKASSKLTRGYKWQLFNFFLLLFLMNIAGFILTGIGLLVTVPVSLFAYIYLYRELSRQS